MPKFLAILGIIISVIILIPAIFSIYNGEPMWVIAIWFVFSSLGVILIIQFVNLRIFYDEDGFVYKNFFGFKRKYTYDQISGIKDNSYETHLYIGKKRIMVSDFSVGGEKFIAFASNKYKALHNGQPLPQITKCRFDVFNGNVKDADQILFVYIIVGVAMVALPICSIYTSYFNPCAVDNTINQSVRFSSCIISQEEIVLTSVDNQLYKISYKDEPTNTKDITAICDEKKTVTVYSKEVTADDGADYYSVKAMVYNDAYLLSFDETNKIHQQEMLSTNITSVIIFLFYAGFVALSVIVGRNPKKFNKKFVRIFFREGYIKYS